MEDNAAPPLEASLRHAADVLRAETIVVCWKDPSDITGRLARWNKAGCAFADVAQIDDVLDLAQSASFVTFGKGGRDRARPSPILDGLARCLGSEAQAWKPASLCTAPFAGPQTVGRLFVLNPAHDNEDTVALTEIAASHFAYELERFALLGEHAAASIARDRVRLARDLHDSFLQDLAAANLRLRVVTAKAPPALQEELARLASILVSQQRRVRTFVQSAGGRQARGLETVEPSLRKLAATLESQWGCEVKVRVRPADLAVEAGLASSLLMLASEGIANAVRHGKAKRVDIEIQNSGSALNLHIKDDGEGMRGRPVGHVEPFSLGQRVKDMGGKVAVASQERGLEVHIELTV